VIDSCAREAAFNPPYDLILLDHDLGGRQMEEHEDCGLTFVNRVRDKFTPDDIIILHSYNPVGAANMAAVLRGVAGEVLVAPFGGATFMSGVYVALRIRQEEYRANNGPLDKVGRHDVESALQHTEDNFNEEGD
jgi:hypothetical protein